MTTSNRLWGAPRIPRRVTEARHHRLRTRRVAVYARAIERTVAELAYVSREPLRRAGVRLDGDAIGRAGRLRCRRRLCLPFRPAPPSRDGRSHCRAVGVRRLASVASTPTFGRHVAEDHPHYRTRPRPTGKDPPESGVVELGPNACGWKCLSSGTTSERAAGARLIPAPSIAIGSLCPITSSILRGAEVPSPCR